MSLLLALSLFMLPEQPAEKESYPAFADDQAIITHLETKVDELEEEVERLEEKLEEVEAEASSGASMDLPRKEPEAITVESTAYTADCEGCSGITYSGVDVRNSIYHEGKRIIAVDPEVIPLGSDVVITLGSGESFKATAQDIGGAIIGSRIDLLVDTKEEALRFGRQAVEVRVLN